MDSSCDSIEKSADGMRSFDHNMMIITTSSAKSRTYMNPIAGAHEGPD